MTKCLEVDGSSAIYEVTLVFVFSSFQPYGLFYYYHLLFLLNLQEFTHYICLFIFLDQVHKTLLSSWMWDRKEEKQNFPYEKRQTYTHVTQNFNYWHSIQADLKKWILFLFKQELSLSLLSTEKEIQQISPIPSSPQKVVVMI